MNAVVWAVIKREYLQRVRSRWFVIATIAAPLLFLGLMLVPIFMASQEEERDLTLDVLDRTGVLYAALAPRIEDAGYTPREVEEGEDPDAARSRVELGLVGGLLIVDEATLLRGEAALHTRRAPSGLRTLGLRQAVVQTALEVRLGGATEDVRTLLGGGALEVELVEGTGADPEDPSFGVAYVGAFILYMTLVFYAVAVMRSVLEEKTSRIVEVVISSVRPFELMLGKILGVGAVGLTQFAIWILCIVVLMTLGLPALVSARPDLVTMDTVREVLPGMGLTAVFLVFFLGGYFIYSGLYAAVGAMCSSEEEAQQAQFPVIMLLVVPILFLTGVIQDPVSPLSVGLSFVPFFTPILMFARAAVGGAQAWEIAVSVGLMAGTVLAVAWVAGRIYRVGILMAGKRPTLPELLRWVREA